MKSQLEKTFGGHAEKVLPHYPPVEFNGSAGAASARAVTDGLFVCPMIALDRVLMKYTSVWSYKLNDVQAPFPFKEASFPYGAAHTLEMRYLFKDYVGAAVTLRPMSPAQQTLSDSMISYWTTFAKSGNSNSSATKQWPELDAAENY